MKKGEEDRRETSMCMAGNGRNERSYKKRKRREGRGGEER